jgi:DNA-binding MurR/RpiR family transcriptional regulator
LQARVQHHVAEDRSNLERALAHNSLDVIEQMLDLLRAAPRIVVVSESFAAPVAESFALMLKEAGLPAIYVSGDIYERAEALTNLVRKDVVIGVTPLEGPSGVARTLQFARSDGATTLACAPSLNSDAARAADHLLYAPGEATGDHNIPSLTSLYSLRRPGPRSARSRPLTQPDIGIRSIACYESWPDSADRGGRIARPAPHKADIDSIMKPLG